MIKKQYIAPHLTSVEFKTERGYATSDIATLGDMQIGLVTELAAQTDLIMGEQMTDLTSNGTSNTYFTYTGNTHDVGSSSGTNNASYF